MTKNGDKKCSNFNIQEQNERNEKKSLFYKLKSRHFQKGNIQKYTITLKTTY